MKIQNLTTVFLAGKSKEPQKKDPSKFYFNLAVVQGGHGGTLTTTEEIFNQLEVMVEYTFVTEFKDQYASFNVVQLLPKPTKESSK